MWEEPCLSGKNGAGTVFFSGCNLHCIYCQNCDISDGKNGELMSEKELEDAIFSLVEQGAECIEMVTPTHYTCRLAKLLERIKPNIALPIVWNSGGYESVESLKQLEGLVDVYMPDFKYYDNELAKKYSAAPNYREVATESLAEMIRQTGKKTISDGGKLLRGVIVRHLVLPGHRADSVAVLRHIADRFGPESIILSLMSQYTPDFYLKRGDGEYKNLGRRVTAFEYDSVMKIADELGFDGYFQGRASANKRFTPEFRKDDQL